jgi:hypothetical protein
MNDGYHNDPAINEAGVFGTRPPSCQLMRLRKPIVSNFMPGTDAMQALPSTL